MSNYRSNAARPVPTTPGTPEALPADYEAGEDAEVSQDLAEDLVEKIRAKRKREEALKSIPEAKRLKIDLEKPIGESTVVVLFRFCECPADSLIHIFECK